MSAAAPSQPTLSALKPGRNGIKPEVGTNLKNCASNTDLAAHFGATAAAMRSRGPSPLGQMAVALGDDPGNRPDADRISGLQLPAVGEHLPMLPQ